MVLGGMWNLFWVIPHHLVHRGLDNLYWGQHYELQMLSFYYKLKIEFDLLTTARTVRLSLLICETRFFFLNKIMHQIFASAGNRPHDHDLNQ